MLPPYKEVAILLRFILTAAGVVAIILVGVDIFQALDGLRDAIDQEAWFSNGTRDLLHGVIGVVIGVAFLSVVAGWLEALDKDTGG